MGLAQFIFRIDDVCPTMRWDPFWEYIDLFQFYGVVPLIGVIPDNCDPGLKFDSPRGDFWSRMVQLYENKIIELAQHGVQHDLTKGKSIGTLSRYFGRKLESEFAGLDLEEQISAIGRGNRVLSEKGLNTTVFMPPNHSFDLNTFRALTELGFSHMSDGISLYPELLNGIVCVPQQLWHPKSRNEGLHTICIHSSVDPKSKFNSTKHFLEGNHSHVIKFSQAKVMDGDIISTIKNLLFKSKFFLSSRNQK